MTKYEYKKFQIKIGKTRRYPRTRQLLKLMPKAKLEFGKCKLCDILECLHVFEVRFCNKQTHTCRFFPFGQLFLSMKKLFGLKKDIFL